MVKTANVKTKENEHIGIILKNLKPLHNLEYKVVFHLHENTFFQKLISKEVLDKVRIRPEDYFKSLITLDYFSRIIDKDYGVCDNLENLSRILREKEKESGVEDGEKGNSYLSLESAVFEIGAFINEKRLSSKNKEISKKEEGEIRNRYSQGEKVDLSSPNTRKLDNFYEAMGEMVSSQASEKARAYLEKVNSREDIGAIIFSDSVLGVLENESSKKDIYSKLDKGDYCSASISALNALMKESTLEKIGRAIEKNGK